MQSAKWYLHSTAPHPVQEEEEERVLGSPFRTSKCVRVGLSLLQNEVTLGYDCLPKHLAATPTLLKWVTLISGSGTHSPDCGAGWWW